MALSLFVKNGPWLGMKLRLGHALGEFKRFSVRTNEKAFVFS
jgi:hypothetical protein